MERARRDRRIEDCPDRWNDFEVRARLRILRRQRGRFRPACHGQAHRNSGDSVPDTQAFVPPHVSLWYLKMQHDLKGKGAVVTVAPYGIGEAIATPNGEQPDGSSN